MAAPAFKEIARGIVNYLEIPPTMPEEQVPPKPRTPSAVARSAEKKNAKGPAVVPVSDGLPRMPDVRGMTMRAILSSLSGYSLCFEFDGSGVAFRQDPGPGEKLDKGQTCQIAFRKISTE